MYNSNDPGWPGLASKLIRRIDRRAFDFLDDELANKHSRIEQKIKRPEINHLQSNGAVEPGMDCRSSEMHKNAASSQRTLPFNARAITLPIEYREIDSLNCIRKYKFIWDERIWLSLRNGDSLGICRKKRGDIRLPEIEGHGHSGSRYAQLCSQPKVNRACVERLFRWIQPRDSIDRNLLLCDRSYDLDIAQYHLGGKRVLRGEKHFFRYAQPPRSSLV